MLLYVHVAPLSLFCVPTGGKETVFHGPKLLFHICAIYFTVFIFVWFVARCCHPVFGHPAQSHWSK